MSKRVVTFGEIMLRLAPYGYGRFVQSECFEATYGGGEANVAVSLANYGLRPPLSPSCRPTRSARPAVNALRRYGVDTRWIVRGSRRIGVYYLERGMSQRPSKVIYDRADSAIAEAVPGDFDWDAIFADADWFHFTGITPALGEDHGRNL